MAALTFYLSDADISAGVLETLATSAPSSKESNQGWNVNKKASPNYCIYYPDAIIGRLDAKWVTTEPSAFSLYGYRTAATLNGTFANTNWALSFKVVNDASYYAQTGYVKFRLWRAVNADGSGATQITPGWQASTIISFTAGSQEKTGTITWSPGGTVTLTNEYLFLEIEWSCAVSGGNNSAYVYWVHNEGDLEKLVTPNLTASYSESVSLAGTAALAEGSGGSSIFPGLSLAATGALSPAAVLALEGSMSLAGGAALTEGRDLQILQAATLGGASALDLVANLLAEMALSLAGSGALAADGQIVIADPALAYWPVNYWPTTYWPARYWQYAVAGGQQYQESVNLAATAAAIKTALLDLLASQSLDSIGAMNATGRLDLLASQSLDGVGGISAAALIQAAAGALFSGTGALTAEHILARLGTAQFDGTAGISLATLLQAINGVLLAGAAALTPAALNAGLGLLSLAVTAGLTASGGFDGFKEISLEAVGALTATLIYEMGAPLALDCLAALTLQSSLTGANLITLAATGQLQEVAQIALSQILTLAGIAGQTSAAALGLNQVVSLPTTSGLAAAAELGLMLTCTLAGVSSLAAARRMDMESFLLLESVSAFAPAYGPRIRRGYRLDLTMKDLELELKLD